MKCKHARKLISLYIDNELGQADRKLFTAHMDSCPACMQVLDETKALSFMFGSAERFFAPYGFATRVIAGIEESKPSGILRSHAFKPFFVKFAEVAFALIIMMVGILAGSMLVTDTNTPIRVADIRNTFHLDVFDPAPPDSIADRYVAMTGVNNEK
jgi:anti-sigma factor RsiW